MIGLVIYLYQPSLYHTHTRAITIILHTIAKCCYCVRWGIYSVAFTLSTLSHLNCTQCKMVLYSCFKHFYTCYKQCGKSFVTSGFCNMKVWTLWEWKVVYPMPIHPFGYCVHHVHALLFTAIYSAFAGRYSSPSMSSFLGNLHSLVHYPMSSA